MYGATGRTMIGRDPRIILAVLVLMAAVNVFPACADKDFLPPSYVFATNYYDSFGAPELYASVIGDPELQRGETALLRVNLVNKGVLYGFRYDTTVGTDEGKHALSLKELEYEAMRTTAFGLKVEFRSDSPYLEVDPETAAVDVEALRPGELLEDPLMFRLTVSNEAPAGVYYVQMPVSYEYPSQVRMTTNEVLRLGLTGIDHMTLYTSANKTLSLPVYVKAESDFEVSGVSGELVPGKMSRVEVTYTNTGEVAAEDAVARIVVMRPLSTGSSSVRLGTIGPGESRTAVFGISTDADALEKDYGIDTEIKYINEDGEPAFSGNMKASVPLKIPEEKIGVKTLLIAGMVILALYMFINIIRNIKKYE